jgi:NADH-quinone oxidoreductase subunit M
MEKIVLNAFIFLPLVLALGLIPVSAERKNVFRAAVVLLCLIQFFLSTWLWLMVGWSEVKYSGGFESILLFQTHLPWIELSLGHQSAIQINYHIGADASAMLLVWMSSLVFFVAALSSWKLNDKVKSYFLLFLVLNASVMGCFLSLDLFLFFLFFEFMLLPMYFLIGIWGGPRRHYASIKFFLYTLFGSLLVLGVLVLLLLSSTLAQPEYTGGVVVHSLDLRVLMQKGNYLKDAVVMSDQVLFAGLSVREVAFWLLSIGLLIKLPAVPFHTWLPDAHVEAATPVSVLLASVLLKVGAFGLMRLSFGLFPDVAMANAHILAALGAVAILYTAWVALAQNDLKAMIAYASVSHMGFVLLGLSTGSSVGFSGAVFQMLSHGLLSAGLFLIAGVVKEQAGTREISGLGGLFHRSPGFTALAVLFFFASLGLPGFSAFVAEFLVLTGAFSAATGPLPLFGLWVPVLALAGLLVGAGYFIWALQRLFFGPYFNVVPEEITRFKAPGLQDKLIFFPLVFFSLLAGLFPSLWLDPLQAGSDWFFALMNSASMPSLTP